MSDKARVKQSRDLRILCALENGFTARQIGKLFGISHTTVLRVKAKRLRNQNAPPENSQTSEPHRLAS